MKKSLHFSGSVMLIIFMSFISTPSVSGQIIIDPCFDPALYNPDGICITLYDPVCGCNGVTYSNSCVAEVSGYSSTSGACGCDIPMYVSSYSPSLNSRMINWLGYSGVYYYEVAYRPALVNNWTTVNIFDTNIQINNLEIDQLYRYKVRAFCSATNQWTAYSPVQSFRTQKCLPPNNISFTQLYNHKIRLNWSQNPYADKYQIFYREAGSSNAWTKALVGLPGRTYKILKNMLPATDYEFKIRSYCNTEYGPFSPLEYFTTSATGNPRLANYNNFSLEQMSPNPATNNLHLDLLLDKEKSVHFSIVDLMGREVISLEKTFTEGSAQYDLNIEALNNGYFVLLINDGENLISEKFVKVDR